MKKYGDTTADYYLGLDIGTNSVGWAVTDTDYSVKKFKGNAMWGVRLFEEAQDASTRRSCRTARRLNARKKQRLEYLELLFSEEIGKKDPLFFTRLSESSLYGDDKTEKSSKYSIFNDKDYTDRDYMKRYPTVWHLRKELIDSTEPHDVRLVYLALHHIIKSRGHFLFETDSDEYEKIDGVFGDLMLLLYDRYGIEKIFTDDGEAIKILLADDKNLTAKKKEIKQFTVSTKENAEIDNLTVAYALVGASVKLADLFVDESLKDVKPNLCLKNGFDENFNQFAEILGDRIDVTAAMKNVFDSARLSQILGGSNCISEAKIRQFDENKRDLDKLKRYIREKAPDKRDRIRIDKKDKLNNLAAYSRHTLESGEHHCSQEDFCKFLKKELPDMANDPEYADIYKKIENNTFLPKLKGSDNGIIPNQLHLQELKKILANASAYLDFLNTEDVDGLTVKDKIIDIFSFKIPYYVGPLSRNSPNSWVVLRSEDKIYPWNFEKVVDTKKSAEGFIINLIGKCTYTGDDVLPADSLLLSEFKLLNEINPLCINGKPITVDAKKIIFDKLFVQSNSKVTKKTIKNLLSDIGLMNKTDELSGIDDTVKSKLKSYHDFKKILEKTQDRALVESIIKNILIFGNDKKMLKSWLKESCPQLDENDIAYILRLKYRDWGRFSETFLTKIYSPDENGEAKNIITMLRETNLNINQLLTTNFRFAEGAEEYRREKYGNPETVSERIDNLYVAPFIKRSIRQTMKIIEEITKTQKAAPKKIFIEVARGATEEQKNKRTKTRKDRLIELYKNCEKDSGTLSAMLTAEETDHMIKSLEATDENRLRKDSLYLYYTQFGRCMYTGEAIDIEQIDKAYDIDHIFPRSKIKDDSIDNKVLVKREANKEKGNEYPIRDKVFFPSTRARQTAYWAILKEKGLISEKKYQRLIRSTGFSDAELSGFVCRQIVETRQSTKAIASLLKDLLPNTRIVYSKAENVTDFRREYEFTKCREINDLHHAKDAYLNIVVGNVYDTKFTADFFKNIRNEEYSLNAVFKFNVKGAWDKDCSIAKVRKVMSKNNILVTRMAYETKGQLFDLQIMPKGKGQLPIKADKEINKYGGYNKLSGAYFCVVEHTCEKNRIRTIEPVFVYKKDLYEADPVRYCTEVLGLCSPAIICPKILSDSLVEINGKKMYITGRSGNRILCKHSYQFICGDENEKYIKAITKYVKRSTAAKTSLPITEFDGLTADKNLNLYDFFIEKLQTKSYSQFFLKVLKTCIDGREKFRQLSVEEQCFTLLQILKAFKCDRQISDLTSIGGKASTGTILFSKEITKNKSANILYQSPTGLFEKKVDLLKK